MQALEYLENVLGLPEIQANAIVAYREEPVSSPALGREVDVGRRWPPELQGIADQVL